MANIIVIFYYKLKKRSCVTSNFSVDSFRQRAKMFYLLTSSYNKLSFKKIMEARLPPVDHNPLDHTLPFKIVHTYNVLVLKSRSVCVTSKTSTPLLYNILTGQSNMVVDH